MLWLDEVKIRIKNKNQILFTKDSEYLQDLIILFQKQNRKTMILWAHDLATESIAQLAEKYPEEMRPREALAASKAVSYTHLDVYKRQMQYMVL